MKTLYAYALKPEAHILKQHFPGASKIFAKEGVELLELNEHQDLLKMGVGLSKARQALKKLPHPDAYSQIIHFGVSGSLSNSLPIQSLITSHHFSTGGQKQLTFEAPGNHLLSEVQLIRFYSSEQPITDDVSRIEAAREGAEAVDMESYAVAEFCQKHNIELLAIRCISDQAGDSAIKDFRHNFELASIKLQNFLIKNLL